MEGPKSFEEPEFPLEPPKKEWPRGKETIMVAEDSESLRDLILAMLSGLGYDVITASGGHEALRMIERRHGVDLVLTDAIMPKGGGFQIVDEVRQRWPQTPILITSGFSEEIEAGLAARLGGHAGAERLAPDSEGSAREGAPKTEAAQAEEEPAPSPAPGGLIEFLPKPFTPEQLALTVRDILDRASATPPTRKSS